MECKLEAVEYVLPIFFFFFFFFFERQRERERTAGTQRFILNLEILNKYLKCKHFKMQTLQIISTFTQAKCYIANVDLKDAYYPVRIDGDDTVFLKFVHRSKLLKFVVFPNGLSPGPQKFTKLTKPSLAMLRIQGYTIAIHISYIIAIEQNLEERLHTTVEIIHLFQKQGFVIHPDKRKFISTKLVEYLGFIIEKWLSIYQIREK